MPLQVFKKAVPQKKHVAPTPTVDPLLGKIVFFDTEDGRIAGRVLRKAEGAGYEVNIAIPNEAGILMVTDGKAIVEASHIEVFAGIAEEANAKRFSSVSALEDAEVKFVEVFDSENPKLIEDYLNVTIEGYGSTFQGTTPADRDGDYVVDGAFTDTIKEFMKNPVMLIDHKNSVHEIAGSYTKVTQTKMGLAIQGKISNRPHMRDVRFLLVEKHLRALSMGGIFFYGQDGRAIEKVTLFEVSLVAVPANQDALFQVRSISVDDAVKAYKYLDRSKKLCFKKL